MQSVRSSFSSGSARSGGQTLLYFLALALAVFVYFFGLDGQHIPKNGDEYAYAHITRMTASSGHLLPLQSQLFHMRNTKPPLLFWQGIAFTHWGREWTLWSLRVSSVLYTLLTVLLVLFLARKISGRTGTGVCAVLVFLAFFSTYRYGRPFLTDPALLFWLSLPLFTLLYRQPAAFESRLVMPLLLGIELGIGLLYKSFALVLPFGITLALWYMQYRSYHFRTFLMRDSGKVIICCCISILVFALWFLLDPNPAAVWREFVLGENFGKLDSKKISYLANLLWGSSSIWSLALTFVSNAGLLAFPVLGLFRVAWAQRREMVCEKRLIWLWVITLFVVFSIPSQRSGRYLMPAMPFVAILLALDWERINRKLFIATLLSCGLALALISYLFLRLQQEIPWKAFDLWLLWLLFAACAVTILSGLLIPGFARPSSILAILLVYLVFSAFMRPLDGPLGSYGKEALSHIQAKQVWVPCNFLAKDEGYRFILPGADVHSYNTNRGLTLRQLAERYPLFGIQFPIASDPAEKVTETCPDCQLIGERLDIRSRQSSKELKEMLLGGKLFELLYVREFLIESPFAPADAAVRWAADECR
jgi:4-amino-4-deoxy-L-arabinose transferase-like glycosyltransferase